MVSLQYRTHAQELLPKTRRRYAHLQIDTLSSLTRTRLCSPGSIIGLQTEDTPSPELVQQGLLFCNEYEVVLPISRLVRD